MGVLDWILPEPGFSTQRENLEATNAFIVASEPQTAKARQLKTEWMQWYQGLGNYDLNYDSDTWDVARNKRAEYLLANAMTEGERQQIKEVIEQGLSSEEQAGQTDRRLPGGSYEEDPPSKAPAYVGLALLGLGLYAYSVFTKKR